MKKSSAVLIAIVSLFAFSLLVYLGFKNVRGGPVRIEESKPQIVRVIYRDKEIDLKNGIEQDFWAQIPSQQIGLKYQVTVLPWPKKVIPSLEVKAFHNRKEIYFYLEWEDSTPDEIRGVDKFSDASAIMFPLDEKAQPENVLMGFLGGANIWQWKASRDKEYWKKEDGSPRVYTDFYYPFEEEEVLSLSREVIQSAVSDLVAIRVGTVTPREAQEVEGRGFWKEGRWRVVFKRSLMPNHPEQAVSFKPGKKLSAFAVWDGSSGDRGGRKSISELVELRIE